MCIRDRPRACFESGRKLAPALANWLRPERSVGAPLAESDACQRHSRSGLASKPHMEKSGAKFKHPTKACNHAGVLLAVATDKGAARILLGHWPSICTSAGALAETRAGTGRSPGPTFTPAENQTDASRALAAMGDR
eukprot:8079033-Pyramimonas_sp.AAC.1